VYKEKKRAGFLLKLLLLLTLIAVILGGIYYFLSTYAIKNVIVEGNVHYSGDEIKEIVMDGVLLDNSWYLSQKYKNKGIENIPFIDALDVTVLTPDTIRITVYEKALAGYVEYLGRYMYFDKDGTVVESSDVMTAGIPQIIGLDFQSVVVEEPLPIDNEEIFKEILNITQLLNKYEVPADKIYFNADYDVTIIKEKVRISLGEGNNLEQKIMVLPELLPSLEGKQGVLRMENYSDSSTNISFEPDKN